MCSSPMCSSCSSGCAPSFSPASNSGVSLASCSGDSLCIPFSEWFSSYFFPTMALPNFLPGVFVELYIVLLLSACADYLLHPPVTSLIFLHRVSHDVHVNFSASPHEEGTQPLRCESDCFAL